jgi:hypothetical protein
MVVRQAVIAATRKPRRSLLSWLAWQVLSGDSCDFAAACNKLELAPLLKETTLRAAYAHDK